jgi:hypothetical protein
MYQSRPPMAIGASFDPFQSDLDIEVRSCCNRPNRAMIFGVVVPIGRWRQRRHHPGNRSAEHRQSSEVQASPASSLYNFLIHPAIARPISSGESS